MDIPKPSFLKQKQAPVIQAKSPLSKGSKSARLIPLRALRKEHSTGFSSTYLSSFADFRLAEFANQMDSPKVTRSYNPPKTASYYKPQSFEVFSPGKTVKNEEFQALPFTGIGCVVGQRITFPTSRQVFLSIESKLPGRHLLKTSAFRMKPQERKQSRNSIQTSELTRRVFPQLHVVTVEYDETKTGRNLYTAQASR